MRTHGSVLCSQSDCEARHLWGHPVVRAASGNSVRQRVPSRARVSSQLRLAEQLARAHVRRHRSALAVNDLPGPRAHGFARRARIAFGRETGRYFHSATKSCFEQDRFSTPRHSCPFFARAEIRRRNRRVLREAPARGGTPIATRRKPVVAILHELQKSQRGDTHFFRASTVSPTGARTGSGHSPPAAFAQKRPFAQKVGRLHKNVWSVGASCVAE